MNVFAEAAKICSRCQGSNRKRKSSRTSIDPIDTTSEQRPQIYAAIYGHFCCRSLKIMLFCCSRIIWAFLIHFFIMMVIFLACRNLKNAVSMHEMRELFFKLKQKTANLWSCRVIVFKILVFCHFMLDYAPIALFENLCFRSWIMQFMLFDAGGINLWSLTSEVLIFVTSQALQPFRYYSLKIYSACVAIDLICAISIVMCGQIVSFPVTCKIN